MRFLLGDSTDAGLEFNYLAFLKDVIDCAVVLLEHEGTMTSGGDRRRGHEKDATVVVSALEELCRRSTELAEAVAKEQGENAIGRCASSIVAQTRELVEREIGAVRTALAADLAKVAQDDVALRAKGTDAIDKLLRAHELPGAERVIEVAWTGSTVKAVAKQKTGYGVEATTNLDIPKDGDLVVDLRVDRIAENAELNALEVGGWLKKSDKLVPYKIGRYHVLKVTAANDTTVRLRSTAEPTSGGFDLVLPKSGDLTVEGVTGEPVRELTIDGSNRAVLEGFVKKLDTQVRALADKRGATVVSIDGKSMIDQPRSGVLAERLITAVAPMVQKIVQHSRSPGELVLRRMLGEDRREEIFTPVADLTRRWQGLPPASRELFSALRLEIDPAAPLPEHSGPQRRQVPTSVPVNRPRLPTGGAPPVPPAARAPTGPTPHLPTVLVPPAGTRATTQTIPVSGVPVHSSVQPAAVKSPTPAAGNPSTLKGVEAALVGKEVSQTVKIGQKEVSVARPLPSAESAKETPAAVSLASVWGEKPPAPEPEEEAAPADEPAEITDSPPSETNDVAEALAAIPSAVSDDSDEALEGDDLIEEDEASPGGADQAHQMLPSVADAIARAEKNPESRQARLDRLNDPVQYARLSAAIEAALGEIEDDEPQA